MRLSSMALAAALAAAPSASRAATSETNFQLANGADLAALCGAQNDDKLYTAAQNFCEGFALGVYSVLAREEAAGGVKTFCLPNPAPTRDEAKAGYVTFIAETPKAASAIPEDSVLLFLQTKYPCGGKK